MKRAERRAERKTGWEISEEGDKEKSVIPLCIVMLHLDFAQHSSVGKKKHTDLE